MTQTILRVGILTDGGQAIQNLYLPVLRTLHDSYRVAAIYDSSGLSSEDSTANDLPKVASNPEKVLDDPSVDLVLNFMPNEYHETYTVAALEAGKHVMVETPVSLSIPSAKRIIEAEKRAPNQAKVFVASARRHAPCFEVFKKEAASLDRIYYARCRNIAGPHLAHTATTPKNKHLRVNGSLPIGLSLDDQHGERLRHCLLQEVFLGEDLTEERLSLSRFLASLGCHDLGLMRDTLGYPDAISNITVNEPFYSAVFHYNGSVSRGHHPFTLIYETGTDSVPRCDAHLALYGNTKTVSMHYDLPYAQGKPSRVVVETADSKGDLKRTESVSSWEDAFNAELKALYAFLVDGKPARTTAQDSLQDLKLFQTIFEQYDRQCGTIRTPLG
ncbi:hypothetical protein BDV37DRAFT_75288 [Aspergillus pseudonomiae]|uniref:Gfo/Idh/MocA-like oxidoreductase N-terminal domain-containing protein n=1 Tax=Aspergillus pseudonomiae TaxID=1506151 RepID=A0A5N7CTK3_9EURO|nr:uncharacterized protein BDV37DRAFT_75288 [Aspergillus pseudonomiae]KAE8397037.1 hypothetical protein BDV37DRAFT_75288 [Aspergillus pseudonomiae]